jgi:hypothetical protein
MSRGNVGTALAVSTAVDSGTLALGLERDWEGDGKTETAGIYVGAERESSREECARLTGFQDIDNWLASGI